MRDDEQLEFLLSQYLDGTLSVPERKALEIRLKQDPVLRQSLEEYSKLDELLRTSMPLPRMQWDDLGDRISSAVWSIPAPRSAAYRLIPALAAITALAACALLAIGLRLRSPRGVSAPVAPVVQIASAQVIGPAAESPVGTAYANVALAPPPNYGDMRYDIVAQPSHVYIASAIETADH
jgi:anti-sigma factor RsiW